MKTEKLYDDGHLFEFAAKVIECIKNGENYKIVLDRTAFFPEGGGQCGDSGKIGEAVIFDTQIENGIIYHFSKEPIAVGSEVNCTIDSESRFRRMQNHSGEHIVSGIVHKMYGYDNVGFHLGEDVTVDFNGELSKQQLREVEKIANEAIYKNVKFTISYPSSDELQKLNYRSKLDLTDDVRIVTIDGYDCCACCAPHISSSGEIGIIKILDSARHRGGTRLHMLCGFSALEDYNKKNDNLYEIAVKLCSKQNETAEIFAKFVDDVNLLKQKNAELQREIVKLKSENIDFSEKNIVIFEDDVDMSNLRKIVLEAVGKCNGICAGFSGNDNDGYNFAIASSSVDLRTITKEITTAILGKGGGSGELIQGKCTADKETIKRYFSEV